MIPAGTGFIIFPTNKCPGKPIKRWAFQGIVYEDSHLTFPERHATSKQYYTNDLLFTVISKILIHQLFQCSILRCFRRIRLDKILCLCLKRFIKSQDIIC